MLHRPLCHGALSQKEKFNHNHHLFSHKGSWVSQRGADRNGHSASEFQLRRRISYNRTGQQDQSSRRRGKKSFSTLQLFEAALKATKDGKRGHKKGHFRGHRNLKATRRLKIPAFDLEDPECVCVLQHGCMYVV